jgi:uncharacterized protein YdhG (YjbR/CyaY superfamily)
MLRYAIPGFRLNGTVLTGFLATRRSCCFFPFSDRTLTTLAGDVCGYEQTKGSLHFEAAKALAVTLVRKLISKRIAEEARAHMARHGS